MQRLGPQDASFIYLETPFVHQHVGGVAILDPSTRPDGKLRYDDLVEVRTDDGAVGFGIMEQGILRRQA